MRKLLLTMIMLVSFVSFTSATTTYLSKTENGHAYKVMKVSLDGKSKIVVSVVNNMMPAQSLKTLMDNVWGTHAINGWYFCPDEGAYSRCEGNTTDGLRVSNGTLYSKRSKSIAMNKSVFGFDKDWLPILVANKGTYQQDSDVDRVYNGMMMPTLVKDWINVAVLNDEMNNDPKQGKAANKTFICSTQDNSIIYMGYVDGQTFSSLADYIIETFGCYNAIQLDNWWSKAMINNSKYVAGPWRNIMDAFVIVEWDNVWTKIAPINMATETPNTEELQTAVAWMYSKGLTSKSTVADYLPSNTMTREEASKFFSVFAKTIYDKSENSTTACNFYDIKRADPTLTSSITSACKLGIFKWYKGNFTPLDKLTNAQAITVLMRIMVGTLPEPTTAFYTNYLLKAKEFSLIENVNVSSNITRWEAAILLYKANAYREKNVVAQPNVVEDICETDAMKEYCAIDSVFCSSECRDSTTITPPANTTDTSSSLDDAETEAMCLTPEVVSSCSLWLTTCPSICLDMFIYPTNYITWTTITTITTGYSYSTWYSYTIIVH